jgi:hypothetical protein
MSNFFWKLSFVILFVVLPPVLPGSAPPAVVPALDDPVVPVDFPVLDFLVYCIFLKN